MMSFVGYINNAVIKFLIYLCFAHVYCQTHCGFHFLSDFMYLFNTVVHTYIKVLVFSLGNQFSRKTNKRLLLLNSTSLKYHLCKKIYEKKWFLCAYSPFFVICLRCKLFSSVLCSDTKILYNIGTL